MFTLYTYLPAPTSAHVRQESIYGHEITNLSTFRTRFLVLTFIPLRVVGLVYTARPLIYQTTHPTRGRVQLV